MRRTIQVPALVLSLVAVAMAAGCSSKTATTPATSTTQAVRHVAGMNCGKCHTQEQALWSSASDQHGYSAAQILNVPAHNRDEVLKDDCLLCHAMFQATTLHAVVDPKGSTPGTKIPKAVYGPVDDKTATYYSGAISHFITPINTKGSWTVTAEWQATRCEVCHQPSSTDKDKLAKYGAWLDTQPQAAYIQLDTGMPTAYNYVFNKKNAYVTTDYANQSAFSVHATKLCDSCHDPDDQGSYVTAVHASFGCIDCHKTHDFTPERDADAVDDSNCNKSGCHTTAKSLAGPGDPGVVHTNHIP